MPHQLTPPLAHDDVAALRAGDEVRLSGVLYTARDAAHKRLCALVEAGDELPVDLRGQVIYFTGPTPPQPGMATGSAGPTTSYRMDAYSPVLIRGCGLRGMIGKGDRSPEVVAAMQEHGCVYFAAVGGAGALIASHIKTAEVVCYEDLGTEAVRRLTVEDLPVVVAIDSHGANLYTTGPPQYRR